MRSAHDFNTRACIKTQKIIYTMFSTRFIETNINIAY